MVDVHTKAQRSYNMSMIRNKDTRPEMVVRSCIHRMGYRYRLHDKKLPGKPDLVLPKYKKIIFVHGCFWHMHNCRYGRVKPKTNAGFWDKKRTGNRERDKVNIKKLKKDGWSVLVIWECQIKKEGYLTKKLEEFLINS